MEAIAYTLDEAADELKVSKSTIEKLVYKTGELKTFKVAGCRRIAKKTLEDFIEGQIQ